MIYHSSISLIGRRISVEYTNWKGVRSVREIEVDDMWFGTTPYHTEPQLLFRCYDFEKQDYRDFAVKDFHWETLKFK